MGKTITRRILNGCQKQLMGIVELLDTVGIRRMVDQ